MRRGGWPKGTERYTCHLLVLIRERQSIGGGESRR